MPDQDDDQNQDSWGGDSTVSDLGSAGNTSTSNSKRYKTALQGLGGAAAGLYNNMGPSGRARGPNINPATVGQSIGNLMTPGATNATPPPMQSQPMPSTQPVPQPPTVPPAPPAAPVAGPPAPQPPQAPGLPVQPMAMGGMAMAGPPMQGQAPGVPPMQTRPYAPVSAMQGAPPQQMMPQRGPMAGAAPMQQQPQPMSGQSPALGAQPQPQSQMSPPRPMAGGGVIDGGIPGFEPPKAESAMRRYSPIGPRNPSAMMTPAPEDMAHRLPNRMTLAPKINVKLPRPKMPGKGAISSGR